MNLFAYRQGALHCEDRPVTGLAAEFGTPLYVYSAGTFALHLQRLRAAFAELDPLLCYSVKCCPNVHVLRWLAAQGCGFDVVSGGELYRAQQAGAAPETVVFAGVGKSEAELTAALEAEVAMINIESASELALLAGVARRRGQAARVAIRIIPDVDAHTHDYTTTGTLQNKFGVPLADAAALYEQYARHPHVHMCGLHLHIGSPVYDPQSYVASIERALALVDQLRAAGHTVDTLDIGGGFGAHYRGSEAPPAQAYAAVIVPLLRKRGLRIILEPGRSLAATAGVLVTRVLHVKETGTRRFVVTDASMNDLIRPALYQAYHFIWPVDAGERVPADWAPEQPFTGLQRCDVVGPVCESGDFLAKERLLPSVQRGDLLAIFSCGAYAMAMASQYNSRPRGAELWVDGGAARLIRRRETYDDLLAAEQVADQAP